MLNINKLALITAMSMALTQPGFTQIAPAVQPGQLDINNSGSSQDVRQSQLPAPQISERQAISLAREQFSGNVLRISLIGQGQKLRYQIRMENEGKIFTVFVDANTGAVSGG